MSNARATRPRLHHLAERVASATALDGPAEAVAKTIREAIPRGPVKDTLSGTWLGHALHPFLTDLPIGTWTSAAVLDVVGGRAGRPAARRLIATGILAAVPTAASGLNDWADTTPKSDPVRRVGAVHAVANVTALALYAASFAARSRGRHGRGVAFGFAGIGASSPVPTSRSAASSSPPRRSRMTALVHVPTGSSCSSGCSAWPSHVPLSASLTGPRGTVSRTHLAIGSATGSSCSRSVMRSAISLAAGERSGMEAGVPG